MSFSHQIGTRVRLSIMKSISKRQKECDPNAVCSVSAFTARPLLRWKFLIVLTLYVRHCQTFIKVQVLDHANNISQSCFQSTNRLLRFLELYREFSDKFYFFSGLEERTSLQGFFLTSRLFMDFGICLSRKILIKPYLFVQVSRGIWRADFWSSPMIGSCLPTNPRVARGRIQTVGIRILWFDIFTFICCQIVPDKSKKWVQKRPLLFHTL